MNFIYRLIIIVLGIICVCFQTSPAQSTGKESLSHLKGVYVNVAIQGHAKGKGLSEREIKTNTEIQLRKAGINIYTEEEYVKQESSPVLLVSINGYERAGLLSFSLEINVNQTVKTSAGKKTRASTYFTERMIGAMRIKNSRKISKLVRQRVRTFINDWMSVREERGDR